jgi:hypothetical protein
MSQYHHDKTSKQTVAANWDTLRIAHFNQAGELLMVADQGKITSDAKRFNITDDLSLPPAFTTLQAAEDFVGQVISSYSKNNYIRSCITGHLIEEKQCEGTTYFLPFVRVMPSPHAPGQPLWEETRKLAETINSALGQSSDELRQHEGTYDSGRQRGRVMVNTLGNFQGIIFVGGNSLNKLIAPGRVWMLTKDGLSGDLGVK